MFITETSNGNPLHLYKAVMNNEIYKSVTHESLLCWQRVLLANTLANNGQEWTELFKINHSGTYNNQYMIVDTKRFTPGVGAKRGFLWIVEEMPGLIVSLLM
jgi:hypothetical protein